MDVGAPFDAGDADLPAAIVADEPQASWPEKRVRMLLQAKGSALHGLIAVDAESDEWLYTSEDLGAIAPPLTAILNRYDATRAAAATGDEIALMFGLGGYVARSLRTRRQDQQALAAQADPYGEDLDDDGAPSPEPEPDMPLPTFRGIRR